MKFRIQLFLLAFFILPISLEAKFNFAIDGYQVNSNKGVTIFRISPLGHRGGFSTAILEEFSKDKGSFFPFYANIILLSVNHPLIEPKYFEDQKTTRVPIFASYLYFGFGYFPDSYRRIGLSFYLNPLVAVPLELKIDHLNRNGTGSTSVVLSYSIGTWLTIGR